MHFYFNKSKLYLVIAIIGSIIVSDLLFVGVYYEMTSIKLNETPIYERHILLNPIITGLSKDVANVLFILMLSVLIIISVLIIMFSDIKKYQKLLSMAIDKCYLKPYLDIVGKKVCKTKPKKLKDKELLLELASVYMYDGDFVAAKETLKQARLIQERNNPIKQQIQYCSVLSILIQLAIVDNDFDCANRYLTKMLEKSNSAEQADIKEMYTNQYSRLHIMTQIACNDFSLHEQENWIEVLDDLETQNTLVKMQILLLKSKIYQYSRQVIEQKKCLEVIAEQGGDTYLAKIAKDELIHIPYEPVE